MNKWRTAPNSQQATFESVSSSSSTLFEKNSHVFLGQTGGLPLLHGLVGTHPGLCLRLSPSPPPLVCSCSPATLHIHPPCGPRAGTKCLLSWPPQLRFPRWRRRGVCVRRCSRRCSAEEAEGAAGIGSGQDDDLGTLAWRAPWSRRWLGIFPQLIQWWNGAVRKSLDWIIRLWRETKASSFSECLRFLLCARRLMFLSCCPAGSCSPFLLLLSPKPTLLRL